jgi:putative membrane protein insertion efficiency factor
MKIIQIFIIIILLKFKFNLQKACQFLVLRFKWSFCHELKDAGLIIILKTDFNLNYYLCLIMNIISRALAFILSLPVLFYRYSISPFLRPSCRHIPSCSQFMLDALKMHGPFSGLIMGTGRILRCRPGGTHGYDPVPLFHFRRYKPFIALVSRFESGNRLKR